MKTGTYRIDERLLKMEIHFALKEKRNNFKTLEDYKMIQYDIAFNWSMVLRLYKDVMEVSEIIEYFINRNSLGGYLY